MAAVIVCVILGSATAASERGATVLGSANPPGSAPRSEVGEVAVPPKFPRSEAVVAYGPNKVGAADGARGDPGTPALVGEREMPGGAITTYASSGVRNKAAPASLSTAQQEGANDAGHVVGRSALEVAFLSRTPIEVRTLRRTAARPGRLRLADGSTGVAALRRYIAAKHAATLAHTCLLGRPAWWPT